MARSSALRTYSRRVRKSKCKGLRGRTCNKTKGCKYTSKGTKRNFCRKSSIRRRTSKRALRK